MRIIQQWMPGCVAGRSALDIGAPRWQAALEHLAAGLVLVVAEVGVIALIRAYL